MLCLAGFLHALAGLGGLARLGVERELSEMILSLCLPVSVSLSLSLCEQFLNGVDVYPLAVKAHSVLYI